MAPRYDSDDSDAPKKKKRKDPNKPKRAMSAFFLYSQANRSRIKEENPEASFGDIARLLAAAFKELDENERAIWDAKASEDKVRYQDEMEGYEPNEDFDGPKKKKKKDPNAPKSAYFLFSNAMRDTIKEENPEAGFGDIAKLLSARFKALSEGEKAKWQKKADADKERYKSEMESYSG